MKIINLERSPLNFFINPNPKLFNINDTVPEKNHSLFSYLKIIDLPNKHSPVEKSINPKRAKA